MKERKHPTISIPFYNTISAVNLEPVISQSLARTQLDTLEYYNDIELDLTKNHIKKFFYHNFIKEICETYINSKTFFTLIFYYKEDLDSFTGKEVQKVIKLINKNLPISIYTGKVPFEHIKQTYISGEVAEECEKIKIFTDKKFKKDYCFDGITSISKKYGLNFLSEQYFNDLDIKYRLIR